MTGIELIAQERDEQLTKHGRSVERDVHENRFSQLIDGAMALLMTKWSERTIPSNWDKERWDKMRNKTHKERIIIAAALLAAELDRMTAAGEE